MRPGLFYSARDFGRVVPDGSGAEAFWSHSKIGLNRLRERSLRLRGSADTFCVVLFVVHAKIGSDTVNGRSTVKYEGVSNKGEKAHIWVDTKLHCVIKADQATGGGIELRNIQEGPQPASLFEIPSGYTKFDMGAIMQRQ